MGWLESRGILHWGGTLQDRTHGPWYGDGVRRSDGTYGSGFAIQLFPALNLAEDDRRSDGTYASQGRKLTVAEDAGLKLDDVYRYVEVNYDIADRTWDGYDSVFVYFFFDARDRLIRHWMVLKHTKNAHIGHV